MQRWRLNDVENTSSSKYQGQIELMPPGRRWEPVCSRDGSAPTVSFGTSTDLLAGDAVTLTKDDEDVDWSGCPESQLARRFAFSKGSRVRLHRVQGDWFYPAVCPTKVAPVAAVGLVRLMGKEHRISQEGSNSGLMQSKRSLE